MSKNNQVSLGLLLFVVLLCILVVVIDIPVYVIYFGNFLQIAWVVMLFNGFSLDTPKQTQSQSLPKKSNPKLTQSRRQKLNKIFKKLK